MELCNIGRIMNENLSEKLSAVSSELAAVRQERDQFATRVEEVRLKFDAANGEADYFKNKFESAMRAAKEREASLIEEGKNSATAHHNITLEIPHWQKRCAVLEEQVKKEREKFLRQEQELMQGSEKHRIRADEERLERTRLENALSTAKNEVDEKQGVFEKLDAALRVRDKELRLLRHEAEILRTRTEEAVKTESTAKAACLSAQTTQKQTVEEYEKKVQRFEHELARQSGLLSDAVKQRERSEFLRTEELSTAERKIERLQQQITENKKRINEEQERARELQANFAASRHDFSELQTQYEKLDRKFLTATETARGDRVTLLAEIRNGEKELRDAREKMHEVEKMLALERRSASTQVEQLRAQLRNAILVADREKNDLKDELTRLRNDANRVEERGRNFEQEIATVRQASEKTAAQFNEALNGKTGELQQLTTAFQEEKRRNQVLEDQVVSLRSFLEEMEKRLRSAQATAHQSEKANEQQQKLWQEKFDEQQQKQQTVKSERDGLALSLQTLKEKENHARSALREARQAIAEMQEGVTASAASKAYHREKQGALESALTSTRSDLRKTQQQFEEAQTKLQNDRDNYLAMEQQLKETHQATLQRLQAEYQQGENSSRSAITNLNQDRDNHKNMLSEETRRGQEMLQNLLAMRDELENTQNASNAAKNFLKEKLKKAEEELAVRKNELAQERNRRSEMERQLRELRQKMQFA